MSTFKNFLSTLPDDESKIIKQAIMLIMKHVPTATEGLSYGLPAFKFNDRPLLGFGKTKQGLRLYPFDPRVIDAIRPRLKDYEVGKGVIGFSATKPLPDELILLMIDLRLQYLKK